MTRDVDVHAGMLKLTPSTQRNIRTGKYGCFVSEWVEKTFCTDINSASIPVNYYYYTPDQNPNPARGKQQFVTPTGTPDMQLSVAAAVTVLTISIVVVLMLVASLASVPRPVIEGKDDGEWQMTTRRRGSIGRRTVRASESPAAQCLLRQPLQNLLRL